MAIAVSGPQFGWKIALRIGLFAALTLGFPFIVYGIVLASKAKSVLGAGGAVAVVAAVYLKPVIIGVFILSLLVPCWRRMRTLGLPPYWAWVIPALFAFDWNYFFVVGSHWGAAFSLGILRVEPPYFGLTGVFLLLAMAFAAAPDDGEGRRFGVVAVLAAVLASAVIALASMMAWKNGYTLSLIVAKNTARNAPVIRSSMQTVAMLQAAKPYLCLALCVVAGWMVLLSRQWHDPGLGARIQPTGPAPAQSLAGTAGAQNTSTSFGRRRGL